MLPQPAVPASTVAYTNTTGQTAFVTITGGTVTSINVPAGGTQVATATNYMATVAAGQTIAITYSVVPSWYWSTMTPAVPASGTAVANSTGKPLYVVLAAGTVTAVSVNGASVATSSPANVALPPGGSITLTYSVAPVWSWLDLPWLAPPPSTGTAYAQENTVPASGVAGYSPVNDLPYPAHAEGGLSGLGVGVAN